LRPSPAEGPGSRQAPSGDTEYPGLVQVIHQPENNHNDHDENNDHLNDVVNDGKLSQRVNQAAGVVADVGIQVESVQLRGKSLRIALEPAA
jgi:hypothetical protein